MRSREEDGISRMQLIVDIGQGSGVQRAPLLLMSL
jgi:hypothetical protein